MKRLLQLWVILMVITALITCWFAYQAGIKGWKYIRLSGQVPAEVLQWNIKKISTSQYALHATYCYVVDGRELTAETLFSSPRYPNLFAAELDLKRWKAEKIHAWYQKTNPQFSSLEKRFPKKELINVVVSLGVLLYFYFAKGLLSYRQNDFSELSDGKQA